jgi:hypothetical protein
MHNGILSVTLIVHLLNFADCLNMFRKVEEWIFTHRLERVRVCLGWPCDACRWLNQLAFTCFVHRTMKRCGIRQRIARYEYEHAKSHSFLAEFMVSHRLPRVSFEINYMHIVHLSWLVFLVAGLMI